MFLGLSRVLYRPHCIVSYSCVVPYSCVVVYSCVVSYSCVVAYILVLFSSSLEWLFGELPNNEVFTYVSRNACNASAFFEIVSMALVLI